jgi:hypothetical protein
MILPSKNEDSEAYLAVLPIVLGMLLAGLA